MKEKISSSSNKKKVVVKLYNKIEKIQKFKLINDLLSSKYSIKHAASKNEININSAKYIW